MRRAHNSYRLTLTGILCAGVSATGLLVTPTTSMAQTDIEEVIVTARKRSESLQEVPVSVSAFASSDIAMRGSIEFGDLLQSIPNVTSGNGLQIRGIGYNTRNIGIEAGATVYVDGVFTGRPPSFNQNLADVESVEVLRGPQGALFGKNSIAGVVSITTVAPKLGEFSGSVLGSLGYQTSVTHEQLGRGQATVNIPVSEKSALRITAEHYDDNGYGTNRFDNSLYNQVEQTTVRAAYRWDISDDIQIVLRGNYSGSRSNVPFPEPISGIDPQTRPPRQIIAPGPFTAIDDTAALQRTYLRGGSATLTYDINEALTLASITAYAEVENPTNGGFDNSPRNNYETDFFNSDKHFTEEIRATGRVGKLDYVAGVFYLNQKTFQENIGIFGVDLVIPGIVPGGVKQFFDPTGEIETESVAGYLDVIYNLTEAFQLEVGGRMNYEKKDFAFQVKSTVPLIFWEVPPGTDSASDTDFSPTIGLRYHIADGIMAYGRYAKGYKSGGWNADFISRVPGAQPPTIQGLYFEPENAATFELGLKTDFADGKVTANLAAFYTDFSNLQVNQFNGVNLEQAGNQLSVTSNAGKATIKGFEVEGTWRPTTKLQLSAGVGHQEATYDRFDNAGGIGVSAAGKDFQNVPEWTGNASAQYAHPLVSGASIRARADYAYIGSRFGDVLNTSTFENPSYSVANARIGYVAPDERWQVYLWSNNITNRSGIENVSRDTFAVAQAADPVRLAVYQRPRTVGIEARINF